MEAKTTEANRSGIISYLLQQDLVSKGSYSLEIYVVTGIIFLGLMGINAAAGIQIPML